MKSGIVLMPLSLSLSLCLCLIIDYVVIGSFEKLQLSAFERAAILPAWHEGQ